MKRSRIKPVSDKQLAKLAERQAFSRKVIASAKTKDGRWQCKRCKATFSHYGLIHPHHVLPISQGGSNAMTNGVPLCTRCHRLVHDRGTDEHGYGGDYIITRNPLGIHKETG